MRSAIGAPKGGPRARARGSVFRVTDTEHRVTGAEHRVTAAVADHLHGPFGNDTFGRLAERFARLFGTPQFIIVQTVLVAAWITVNAVAFSLRWDPTPSSC